MDVLALMIYGLVLFPRCDQFIDVVLINAFMAYKHRSKKPDNCCSSRCYSYKKLFVMGKRMKNCFVACQYYSFGWLSMSLRKIMELNVQLNIFRLISSRMI